MVVRPCLRRPCGLLAARWRGGGADVYRRRGDRRYRGRDDLLLFGEIIPKVYANRFAPKFARRMAVPLVILDKAFQPLIFILVKSTTLVNRRLAKKGQNISMDDLSEALDLATDVVEDEKEMLERFVEIVRAKDPDVIEGHNIFNPDRTAILAGTLYPDADLSVRI